MKKENPILANELNRRIEAELQGQPPPVSEAVQPEAELATKLINLAQDTHPDPNFVARLGSQLANRAAKKQKLQNTATLSERPSFWQRLSQLFKEGTTMNRNKYLLGALGVLMLIVAGAYIFISRGNNGGSEPSAVVTDNESQSEEAGTAVTDSPTTEEAAEVAELPVLPSLGSSGPGFGLGGGGATNRPLGGGGGLTTESAAYGADDASFIYTDPFSGTIFTLNTTLPADQRLASVLQNVPSAEVDLEEVRQLASRFGFTTQLYREQYPVYEPAPGELAYNPPVVYHLFDGPRSLIIDQWGVYYNDMSIVNDYENPISFEAAVPIAEAFLQERGLLDFEYEVLQIWGSDVNIIRKIDGQPTNQPEMTVGVSHDGRVFFVSYQVLRNAEVVGRYPLISSQEAWETLQGGVVENNIFYQYVARPELAIAEPAIAIEEDPNAELYKFWVREFAPGDEIHLYEWPVVFQPVDSDAAPRIQVRNFVVQADAATLVALAEQVGEQTYIWGHVGPNSETIELVGWEPIERIAEPPAGPGIISRDGDQVLFTNRETGSVYLVPDAPADLEDGTEVYLFAWAARDLGQAYPVLDWENIDKIVNIMPDEESLPVEPPVEEPILIDEPFEPFTYELFTVNEVSLAYYTTYSWPTNEDGEIRYEGQPTVIVQPTWKFSGETDTGDLVEFFIQATQPEYLNR